MQPWQWWKFLIPHFIDLAFSLSLFGILTLKIHVKLCTKVIGAILKTQKVFSLFLTLSIPHILSSRWFHRGKGLLFLKIKKKAFCKNCFFPHDSREQFLGCLQALRFFCAKRSPREPLWEQFEWFEFDGCCIYSNWFAQMSSYIILNTEDGGSGNTAIVRDHISRNVLEISLPRQYLKPDLENGHNPEGPEWNNQKMPGNLKTLNKQTNQKTSHISLVSPVSAKSWLFSPPQKNHRRNNHIDLNLQFSTRI